MSSVNFLEKLLDGVAVEWKQLGELEDEGFVKLGRGNVISKKDLASTPGDFPVYSSSAIGIGEFGRYGKYMFDDERITWSVDGGGRFFFRSAHKYSVTNVCGWMTVLKQDRLYTRFLYHVLSGSWERKVFDYIKKAHPSVIRDEYEIPIPCPDNPKKSLEIQAEIVRILDAMTAHTAELTAELTARKKQYNYYRDKLLSFEDGEVEWKAIEDVFDIFAGGDVPKEDFSESQTDEYNIPILSNGIDEKSLYGWTNIAKIDKPSLTVSARGTIGWTSYREKPFFPIVRLIVLTPKTKISLKYAYYFMKTIEKNYKVPEAGIPQLTKPMIKDIKIPIPYPADEDKSLEAQNQIVAILDKFDALTASITEGLPREIELRQKQYAYCRGLLLHFPHPSTT